MKKLLFPTMLVFMVLACTKENWNDPELQGSKFQDYKLHGPCVENVFTVIPSGGDDTENLLLAFAEAQAAGPGSVVKLVEGTYNIFTMEIHDFCGSFIGAGKNKTSVATCKSVCSTQPILVGNCLSGITCSEIFLLSRHILMTVTGECILM